MVSILVGGCPTVVVLFRGQKISGRLSYSIMARGSTGDSDIISGYICVRVIIANSRRSVARAARTNYFEVMFVAIH